MLFSRYLECLPSRVALMLSVILLARHRLDADVVANRLSDSEQRGGWRLLFDGKSTNGWRKYGQQEPSALAGEGSVGGAQGLLQLRVASISSSVIDFDIAAVLADRTRPRHEVAVQSVADLEVIALELESESGHHPAHIQHLLESRIDPVLHDAE